MIEIAVVLGLVVTGASGLRAADPLGDVTEYVEGVPCGPLAIAAGPDGRLWFTCGVVIGAITTEGVVTLYAEGIAPGAGAGGIAAGPDGNMWFTERGGRLMEPAEPGPNQVAKITPAGDVTEYSTGITAASRPWDIASGPDGNIWVTEASSSGRAVRVTSEGDGTAFPATAPSATAYGITTGPDGNLWYTEVVAGVPDGARIVRITPSGVTTEYLLGNARNNYPDLGITSGPDGNVWFTETYAIGKIGTAPIVIPPNLTG